jgi:hypothetical protein
MTGSGWSSRSAPRRLIRRDTRGLLTFVDGMMECGCEPPPRPPATAGQEENLR